ncbi:ferritin-like domain-containing protein [Kitasatospora sp. McL0602]|uniref:ferritin-like domain-containing protein n=1 Tax=Kitasatospora sp. McL0602 TaxID=3439530 RepID=UPI003F8C523E
MLSPTRRTFLALGAFTGALLVSGCTDDSGPAAADHKRPDPDLPLRTRAVATTDQLLAAYDAAIAGPGAAQAALLTAQRADVAAHRTALATGLPTPSASPSAPATTSTVSTVAALATAEREAAAARLADLDAASPALAKLLAAVSASDALHAAALGDTGPITAPTASASPSASPSSSPSRPPSGSTAVQSALAAEHAAVYGYGVIGGHLPAGPQREDGHASYAAHEARRDAWQRLLATGGATPAAAAAGYRLPFAVTNPATAADLAVHIEAQLTAVYADLVAATTGPLRSTAAETLRDSAFRARHWGGTLPALPGIPA